jgi:hypothetical protein
MTSSSFAPTGMSSFATITETVLAPAPFSFSTPLTYMNTAAVARMASKAATAITSPRVLIAFLSLPSSPRSAPG